MKEKIQKLRRQFKRWFEYPYEGDYRTRFPNKYGIAKHCDVFPRVFESDRISVAPKDYSSIKTGDFVYVIASALPEWFASVYPRLEQDGIEIFLVTGDAVLSAPRAAIEKSETVDLDRVLNGNVIRHWFAQNCDYPEHPKISPIPLGIDYHTLHRRPNWGEERAPFSEQDSMLCELAADQQSGAAWRAKKRSVFVDFHHTIAPNPEDRGAALKAAKRLDNVHFCANRQKRSDYWREMRQHKFVLSPLGAGLDCHRTWEALILGAVPIVKKSTISSLFDGMPIIQLDDYNELTDAMLDEFVYPEEWTKDAAERLTLDYWVNKIRSFEVSAH